MIDLRALRAFVVVGERLNMTRAADVLHISQSALSRQIQGLEHNLGIRLFDRIGKRLVLTAEGDDLLPRAAALIDEAQNLSTRMKAITQGQIGVLRIGATPQSIEALLSHVVSKLHRKYPAIEAILIEGSNDFLLEQVAAGIAHVAIAALPDVHDLEAQDLFIGYLFALVPPDHAFSHKQNIDIRELAYMSILSLRKGFMTRNLFDSACAKAGVRVHNIVDSDSTQTLRALARAGLGIGVVSTTAVTQPGEDHVVPLTLHGQPLGQMISATWNPRRYKSPALNLFLHELALHIEESKGKEAESAR